MPAIESGDVAIEILGRMYPELRKSLTEIFDDLSLYEEAAFISNLIAQSTSYLTESRDYDGYQAQEITSTKPVKNQTRNSRKSGNK